MVDVNSVALSGLYANEKRIAVAAENIANANSGNYKAVKLDAVSNPGGGVATRITERSPATLPAIDSDGNISERPNVSLEEELVGAQNAVTGGQANLKVIQAQDKLNKYLLDIQA